MKYDKVQQSLEEYVQINWIHTAVQFDNTVFNSELYNEYAEFSVVFLDGDQKTVTRGGCYRFSGSLVFVIKTKPSQGTQRALELASAAALMFTSKDIAAVPPLVAPIVTTKTSDLYNDTSERAGWVRAQITTPFYYDIVGA